MTTIVYRDGVIAADSCADDADWRQSYPLNKLVVDHERAVVYALCGHYAHCRRLIASPADARPSLDDDSRVILFKAAREGQPMQIFVFEGSGLFQIEPIPKFAAWGTGFPVATGALHSGASAVEAVRIAALVDPWTGGAIHRVRLDTLHPRATA